MSVRFCVEYNIINYNSIATMNIELVTDHFLLVVGVSFAPMLHTFIEVYVCCVGITLMLS
jgi:hypothetical protein